MSFTQVQITHFSIEAVSERLYANGNHQCHIRVQVMKQGLNAQGQFVRVPLTQRERDSVGISQLSSSLDNSHLVMPVGWGFSRTRNAYDLGLASPNAFSQEKAWVSEKTNFEEEHSELCKREFRDEPCVPCMEDKVSQFIATPEPTNEMPETYNNVPEIINLYVTSGSTGMQVLMAKAQLDVSVFDANHNETTRTITVTTNMSSGSNVFNSRVSLNAITPIAIHPQNLSLTQQTIQDRREDVSKWDVHHQRITLFRWTLPHRLRIRNYISGNNTRLFYALGNTQEGNRFLTRGRVFQGGTSEVNARDGHNGGCVWDHSYRVDVPDTQIAAEVLHVTGCSWTSSPWTGTHSITFLDNFGTLHRFELAPDDSGRSLSINLF